ncbi:MAG: hypothetical protein WBB00_00170 [Mycobacterium sp.]
MDDDERAAIEAEGHDPDHPAVSQAREAAERTAHRADLTLPKLAVLLSAALAAGMEPTEVRGLGEVITPDYVAAHIGAVQSYT